MKKCFIGTNIGSVQDIITNLPSSGTVVLFLDFKKAFDSVNHLFLFSLMLHMGFPPDYVAWVTLLYNQALSVVRHCNWLTKPFSLCRGIRQGCPLSCHLFNIVRQVLIYHLRDCGYFEWWQFLNDPCLLYANDTAIFLRDISQLSMVLKQIELVGSFTGLTLNLDKTIAFDPFIGKKMSLARVTVGSSSVKYLGVFLGLGDVSKLNFEGPLHKAKAVIAKWNKCSLSLDARILVMKTFIFSVFVHILNTVFVATHQIVLLQRIVNDFLWKSCSKVKLSVITTPMCNGGLKMLHVKNIIHNLKS